VRVLGLTVTGRATISALRLNHALIIAIRAEETFGDGIRQDDPGRGGKVNSLSRHVGKSVTIERAPAREVERGTAGAIRKGDHPRYAEWIVTQSIVEM
jgi:hypothetical protein